MFFKRKVQLRDYCNTKFNYLFSTQFESLAKELKNRCDNTFAQGIDNNKYVDHLRGAFLELLGIAFSRTLKRDQRLEVFFLENEFLKKNNCDHLDSIHQSYNSAFGSSPVDGVQQMAIYFSDQFPINNINKEKVIKVYHKGFYQILNIIFEELKNIKLV